LAGNREGCGSLILSAANIAFLGHSYHLMHHLYPRIPFYHYGTAYHALEPELAAVGAKVRHFDR
jgi:fatty acid desaturase